jgi:hypothetical protein
MGQYGDGENMYEEILFQRESVEIEAPSNILEPLQFAYQSLEALSQYYQTSGILGSCLWTQSGIPREEMEITVVKSGRGMILTYGWRDGKGLAIEQYPARYSVSLVGGWRVSFGAKISPTDYELTQRLIFITEPWQDATKNYRQPWRVYLSGEPWRIAKPGEISVRALAEEPEDKSGREMNAETPLCAAPPCTFTEATRPKEVKAMLKFGRDSKWPLRVPLASSLDRENSISVTYPIE